MKIKNYHETIEVPEGITVSLEKGMLTVKGKKGELKRNLFSPKIKMALEGNNISFSVHQLSKKEKTILGSTISHIKNMFTGVTQGFVYKLKICSGHFPMTVSVKNRELSVKNFIGEKIPRLLTLNPDVKVTVEGEVITVEANDVEIAGQTAGLIEKVGSRTGYDKRVFQQGIFITQKPS
ncbi:50S ribosomal protein L6 [Candidatus Woesearchaeota archaeon]|nr:50S ribosomal protein L6 [Candidatus Woesearchaeota archaeon]